MKIFKPFEVIREELLKAEEFSRELLDSKVELVLRAGGYILDSGGKRVRPGLTIIAGKLVDAPLDRLIPVATVMEYMHTATLLHDDIVDGAKLRRGRPSANTVFGNDVAVLVGDYMFAKAIYVLAVYGGEEVLKVSAQTVQDMAEGELLQLEKIGDVNLTEEEYFDIIYRKTASLLSTCCEVGALIGNASEEERRALRDYGKLIGYAFQLVDDAFDYISEEETIGKPAGNDIREGKVTYPLISALKKASEKEREEIAEILSSVEPSREDIERVRQFVLEKGGDRETFNLARDYVRRAKELLSIFPDSPYRRALNEIADFIVERTY
ncbi:polyprenyl synthetase family protein [Phorcysia thermohydrogeniphila]|uniref:Octaprenyl-diphosphate synthase n=1 Tax=Phorcysia thermohydrogeniphila TaxID=936138 RepID=A0A4R1GBD3_9BACT|nr:polyprenyl synthetase family protein [Phorcysia thermohydrogeniphila]TCK03990.1 octaprenyl-diphosphate synthase [Phorcysia thermohydrogeniphila]